MGTLITPPFKILSMLALKSLDTPGRIWKRLRSCASQDGFGHSVFPKLDTRRRIWPLRFGFGRFVLNLAISFWIWPLRFEMANLDFAVVNGVRSAAPFPSFPYAIPIGIRV